jgi:hypothetical protein
MGLDTDNSNRRLQEQNVSSPRVTNRANATRAPGKSLEKSFFLVRNAIFIFQLSVIVY